MKSKQTPSEEINPTLNKTKIIKGNRRLVREKALQILVPYFVSGTDINLLIEHIHNRDFIDSEEQQTTIKNPSNVNNNVLLLSDEELTNIDADAMIQWRPEDLSLGRCIIFSAIQNYDNFVNYIKEASANWDFDRISIIDRTIIIMAIAEFISAIDVPVKVSINEAIELSKIYSTDKAPIFINGVLEKIKLTLEDKNLINKTERGMQ
jgi:N utilization substance protein B